MARKKNELENKEKELDKKISETKSQNVTVTPKIDVQSIKNDLTDYMRMRIDKEVLEAAEKVNKKIINHKNSIIIKRDILIVVLLVACFFLGYNLYNVSSINIDITRTSKNESKESKKVSEKETKKTSRDTQEKSLDDMIEKHGALIDDIYIDENSDYLKNFYKGDLKEEIKLYMALNKLDDVGDEDDTIYIDDDDLRNAYEKLFDSEYSPKSFKYGDNNFRHLSSKSMFIADGKFNKVESNIKREIVEVDEEDDKVKIVTVEGIVKDGKLYDVSFKEIKKYDGGDLKNYEKSLDKMNYEFVKKDDEYKLSKIEKGN